MNRTPEEIAAEAEHLKALKPKVPAKTMFGDDNHAKIDAQIRVLEEDMTEAQIWDNSFPEDDERLDGIFTAADLVAEGEFDTETVSLALDARKWLYGETEEPPSKGWAELADDGE